jgi:hypothetical protein
MNSIVDISSLVNCKCCPDWKKYTRYIKTFDTNFIPKECKKTYNHVNLKEKNDEYTYTPPSMVFDKTYHECCIITNFIISGHVEKLLVFTGNDVLYYQDKFKNFPLLNNTRVSQMGIPIIVAMYSSVRVIITGKDIQLDIDYISLPCKYIQYLLKYNFETRTFRMSSGYLVKQFTKNYNMFYFVRIQLLYLRHLTRRRVAAKKICYAAMRWVWLGKCRDGKMGIRAKLDKLYFEKELGIIIY